MKDLREKYNYYSNKRCCTYNLQTPVLTFQEYEIWVFMSSDNPFGRGSE